jgi:hypothetical protein
VASRASQAAAARSSLTSPPSQPSLQTTTTARRAIPRWPYSRRNAVSAAPSRVPPRQSGTCPPASRVAASGSRSRSAPVTRVSRVPIKDPDSGLLDRLLDHDRHLAAVRITAERRYAARCDTLLPTGLICAAAPTDAPAHTEHGDRPDPTLRNGG